MKQSPACCSASIPSPFGVSAWNLLWEIIASLFLAIWFCLNLISVFFKSHPGTQGIDSGMGTEPSQSQWNIRRHFMAPSGRKRISSLFLRSTSLWLWGLEPPRQPFVTMQEDSGTARGCGEAQQGAQRGSQHHRRQSEEERKRFLWWHQVPGSSRTWSLTYCWSF